MDKCIVTPLLLKSLTRRTLLMISRPRLSNTRTFQMGSPFSLRREAAGGCDVLSPFAVESSWFRLKMRSMYAATCQYGNIKKTASGGNAPICRSRRV
jgi:hypothetical protein